MTAKEILFKHTMAKGFRIGLPPFIWILDAMEEYKNQPLQTQSGEIIQKAIHTEDTEVIKLLLADNERIKDLVYKAFEGGWLEGRDLEEPSFDESWADFKQIHMSYPTPYIPAGTSNEYQKGYVRAYYFFSKEIQRLKALIGVAFGEGYESAFHHYEFLKCWEEFKKENEL